MPRAKLGNTKVRKASLSRNASMTNTQRLRLPPSKMATVSAKTQSCKMAPTILPLTRLLLTSSPERLILPPTISPLRTMTIPKKRKMDEGASDDNPKKRKMGEDASDDEDEDAHKGASDDEEDTHEDASSDEEDAHEDAHEGASDDVDEDAHADPDIEDLPSFEKVPPTEGMYVRTVEEGHQGQIVRVFQNKKIADVAWLFSAKGWLKGKVEYPPAAKGKLLKSDQVNHMKFNELERWNGSEHVCTN